MPKTGVSCLKKVLVHLVEHRSKQFPQQMKEFDCEVQERAGLGNSFFSNVQG